MNGSSLGNFSPGAQLLLWLIAFACYGLAIFAIARWSWLTLKWVIAGCVGVVTLAALAPLARSSDVTLYAMYGRTVAKYHASPYRHPPSDFAKDPWFPRVNTEWRGQAALYGPLFILIAALGMAWAGPSLGLGRLYFVGLSWASVVASLLIIARRTGSPVAVALLGLNPVVVLTAVRGGHNDALVGVLILSGVSAATLPRARLVLAGLLLALAALVKFDALLALGGFTFWAATTHGRRAAARAAAPAIALVLGAVALAGGSAVLRPLRSASSHLHGSPSLWQWPRAELASLLRHLGSSRSQAEATAGHLVGTVALVTIVLISLLLLTHWRGEPELAIVGPMLVYIAFSTWIWLWYIASALPGSLIRGRSRTAAAAVGGSFFLALSSIPVTRRNSPGDWLVFTYQHTLVPAFEAGLIVAVVVVAIRATRRTSHLEAAADGGPRH